MPREGYKTISVRKELYDLSARILEKHKARLRLERIESISDLWEAALLEYVKTHFPHLLKQLEEEES